MATIPPVNDVPYKRQLFGFAGKFGTGANIEINYLQTAITPEQLNHIELIENIPGAEKWDVKDLFQRVVDKNRVNNRIIPYLQNKDMVKFFNPLTLILLPFDAGQKQAQKEVDYIEAIELEINKHKYKCIEKKNYFRHATHTQQKAFSFLEWNELTTKIVAVDGQHRLSALKSWNDDPIRGVELANWTIPVVMLIMTKADKAAKAPNVLEVVRKTFIYINTTAEGVNESRRILLDDESVNCLCTQELIQYAHENDQKDDINDIDKTRLPLIFYDWRGEVVTVKDKPPKDKPAPASIITVREIHEWFLNYILGEQGSNEQSERLGIEDMLPPIESFGKKLKLTQDDATRIRDQFQSHLLPGFLHLMENFEPYKHYIAAIRNIQTLEVSGDHIAQHAFQKLCFGISNEGKENQEAVSNKYSELLKSFAHLKTDMFDELLARDIGMRGIVSAFGMLKDIYDGERGKTTSWLNYAQWFTPLVNDLASKGWFREYEKLSKNERKYLTHITYDLAGGIINYKHDDVNNAFGPLLTLLMTKNEDNTLKSAVWSEASNNLTKPLRRGFRKQVRAEQINIYDGPVAGFPAHVNNLADKELKKRLSQLINYCEIIID